MCAWVQMLRCILRCCGVFVCMNVYMYAYVCVDVEYVCMFQCLGLNACVCVHMLSLVLYIHTHVYMCVYVGVSGRGHQRK